MSDVAPAFEKQKYNIPGSGRLISITSNAKNNLAAD